MSMYKGLAMNTILNFLDIGVKDWRPEQTAFRVKEVHDEIVSRLDQSPAVMLARIAGLGDSMKNITQNEIWRGMDEAWDHERTMLIEFMMRTHSHLMADWICEVGNYIYEDQDGPVICYTMDTGERCYFRIYEFKGARLAYRLDTVRTEQLLAALEHLKGYGT